ncbi:P-type DNA transfer ATPase VirB11 [Shewanella sp. 202IG2-18]|uniref:P-type DNA transfer ATPase VirB11 n=1 Tax=Parashewanella hymeniacidonis TaxID=2807618 RepID=UPI00195FF9FA|nr:P-type DNA transfer ATPase VirB11 [Parashewanella hymeniacidonis]MBM7070733.1 P-type DNA transfer ATPase VirB11 [Parashewanella hymeniacidonis]
MNCSLAINQPQQSGHEVSRSIALLAHLKLLQSYLLKDDVTEVVVNQPYEIQTESKHGWSCFQERKLDFSYCQRLAKLIATYSGQKLDTSHPILSATLPTGERVQIAIPPVTLTNRVSITIRKPSVVNFSLNDYERQGYFQPCSAAPKNNDENRLQQLKTQGKINEFLTLAVQMRKNIIISGSTGSGKTTFFRSLLQLVPNQERLLSIENVDELQLYRTHSNTVSLFYSAGNQGISAVTQKQLLEASLRMKPDRVFVAELIRGDEAFYYLRNINSGHPGSMTTMHAGSPKLALEQLVLLLKESNAGSSLSRTDIKQLLNLCVDVIVQLQNKDGRRFVSEVYYRG